MSVNERHFCMCITPDNLSEADKKRLAGHKAALLNAAQWDAGSVITVRFLEGDAGLDKTRHGESHARFSQSGPNRYPHRVPARQRVLVTFGHHVSANS